MLAAADEASLASNGKLRFFPLTAREGRGSVIVEADGREILDFSSGWTAAGLGYAHPAVVDAVTIAIGRQANTGGISALCPDSIALAQALIALLPEIPNARVYLGNSGTDANDMALRACQAYTGSERIIAFERGYHGGLGLAMGVSGVCVEAGAHPAPHATFLPFPNPLRPHTGDPTTVVDEVIEQLERELSRSSVAAVIVEPIQSDGGVVVPPHGFLRRLSECTRDARVPLIVDEVKVGLGRTGELFDFRHDLAQPDIVTLGKALGGGLPLSAAIGPADILNCAPSSALLTTAGNPVCAAAGLAVVKTVTETGLVQRAEVAGRILREVFIECLNKLGAASVVGDIRGRGLTIGIDLVRDQLSLQGDFVLARKVVYRAWQLGVVIFYVGGHVLEVTPPLTICDEEIIQGARILAQAIHDANIGMVSDEDIAPYTGWQ